MGEPIKRKRNKERHGGGAQVPASVSLTEAADVDEEEEATKGRRKLSVRTRSKDGLHPSNATMTLAHCSLIFVALSDTAGGARTRWGLAPTQPTRGHGMTECKVAYRMLCRETELECSFIRRYQRQGVAPA